jgi:eukaryotic translation initiation factor 2-alpha kinase 4
LTAYKEVLLPKVGYNRYDHLINKFAGITPKAMRAIGVQIALASFTSSLADHLSVSVPRLVKEHRSFGYWSPSRCDVYIVSFQAGLITERIDLATMLWSNGISADIMYESALESSYGSGHGDATAYAEMCTREGIL